MSCHLGPDLLAQDPPAFQRHARTCLDCARLWREKEHAYALLAQPPPALSADRRADLWAGLQAARRVPDRRPLVLGAGAAVLAAAALALAFVYAPRPAEVARIVAQADAAPRVITPGAWVELRAGEHLDIGGRAQLQADTAALVWVDALSEGLELRLAQGEVQLLTMDPDRPLRLRTPTARLSLIGAKARLAVKSSGTEGQVEAGEVIVERTLGGAQRLSAGGAISAPVVLPQAQGSEAAAVELAAAPPPAPAVPAAASSPAAAPAPASPAAASSPAASRPAPSGSALAEASAPRAQPPKHTARAPSARGSSAGQGALARPAPAEAGRAEVATSPSPASARTLSSPTPAIPSAPPTSPSSPSSPAEPRLSPRPAPKAALKEAQALLGKDDRRASELAVEVYQQDVVGPDAGLALCIAADGYRRSGLTAKAAATYAQAAQHANVADEAAYRGATLLHQLGQDDQALAELERVRATALKGALAPERVLLEARIHLGRGRALAAATAIERAGLAGEERSVDAGRLEVARALASAEPQRARALLATIIARRPAESSAWRAAKEILNALP